MGVVKKRKKIIYDDNLKSKEEIINISLDREGRFSFQIPNHYVDVFEKKGENFIINNIPDVNVGYSVIYFDRFKDFETIFEKMNDHFIKQKRSLEQEKVLVIILNSKKGLLNSNNDKYRELKLKTYNSHYPWQSSIKFEFYRGFKEGKKTTIIETQEHWKVDTLEGVSYYDNDDLFTIPYTPEREAVLKAFKMEINKMAEKINNFLDLFVKPETLKKIDDGLKLNNLLLIGEKNERN